VETKIDVSKSFKRFQKHIVDATSVGKYRPSRFA